ncbi:uncharacterized protein METZ01_LOCUS313230 [marine metagenome]|uniref:DNA replication complex GINS family protein n=1 Tax=marine metagenome TaxID=408172 RepID=A0A382NH45_9ZZZZ
MATNLLTLRDLRVQALKERKEGRLTKISKNFYNQVNHLEGQIRDVIGKSKSDTKRLEKSNSDMRKFMDLKLELHKHRERKLTNLAREKVNGQNPDATNVHPNENEYLQSLCSVIEKHRETTLLSRDFKITSIIEGEEPKTPKIMEKKVTKDSEYISVEVLENLPTFTGMDAKNYTLKNGETEIIPIYNAKMLSDAGKVKLVKEVKV